MAWSKQVGIPLNNKFSTANEFNIQYPTSLTDLSCYSML